MRCLVYKQLMAYMTQGFLDKLRQEMFGGMQDLPIRYFDTHQHGDIMSFYTNDIDTLRQLVSEAIARLHPVWRDRAGRVSALCSISASG